MLIETNYATGPITVLFLDAPSRKRPAVEIAVEKFGRCNITRAFTVHEALQQIASDPPRLIITEWAFPGFTLVEFLQTLSEYPEWRSIPSLVVTENPTREIIRKSLDMGAAAVHTKPLDLRVLVSFLDGIFGILRDTPLQLDVTSADIRSRLGAVHRLTPLPLFMENILALANDPGASTRDLADLIQRDMSLTARILKVVNSAYYGFEREIGNINRAIVILGFDEIKEIALASLKHLYPRIENELFNWDQFWLHSLGVAHTARTLSIRAPEVSQDDAFVVGLLHDFGKVVYDLYFQEEFCLALKNAADNHKSLARAEYDAAHIDHAEIGGLVAENWKLPVSLVKAIRYHHNPAIAGRGNTVIHLVHLANALCHHFQIGNSGNPAPDEPLDESIRLLGLQGKSLEEIWAGLNIDPSRLKLM